MPKKIVKCSCGKDFFLVEAHAGYGSLPEKKFICTCGNEKTK